jgi:hypothetical protein
LSNTGAVGLELPLGSGDAPSTYLLAAGEWPLAEWGADEDEVAPLKNTEFAALAEPLPVRRAQHGIHCKYHPN